MAKNKYAENKSIIHLRSGDTIACYESYDEVNIGTNREKVLSLHTITGSLHEPAVRRVKIRREAIDAVKEMKGQ